MFVRDHLAVVSHWARDQLCNGAETAERRAQLQQLIDTVDALRTDLQGPPLHQAENVVSLADFRKHA